METRPSPIVEAIVGACFPPACREEVLGDLYERYQSPTQYLSDALQTVPLVLASQVLRTARRQAKPAGLRLNRWRVEGAQPRALLRVHRRMGHRSPAARRLAHQRLLPAESRLPTLPRRHHGRIRSHVRTHRVAMSGVRRPRPDPRVGARCGIARAVPARLRAILRPWRATDPYSCRSSQRRQPRQQRGIVAPRRFPRRVIRGGRLA